MPLTDQIDARRQRYKVIPRTLIFLQRGRQVLLIKGAPDKPLWPNLYNGIGGHIELGETINQAATRELFEETGIRETDLTLCGMVSIQLPMPQDSIILFVFTGHTKATRLSNTHEGHPEWFDWDSLPTGHLVEDLPTLLPLIQNYVPSQQPFYALYTYDDTGSLKIAFS